MNFIDKQKIAIFKMRQNPDQVAPLLKGRAGGHRQRAAGLVGDDMRQSCLAQAGGAVKKDMIHGLVAHFGGLNGNAQGFHRLVLTDVVIEGFRSEGKDVGFQILRSFLLGKNALALR